jgi:hypothetical protein
MSNNKSRIRLKKTKLKLSKKRKPVLNNIYIKRKTTLREKAFKKLKKGGETKEYSDGTYDGEIVDRQRHGQGIMTYTNGDKYEGNWNMDHKHGKGIYTKFERESVEFEWQWNRPLGITSPLSKYIINNPSNISQNQKYITLLIQLHGSDIQNSICRIGENKHIRIISPAVCGKINIVYGTYPYFHFNVGFNTTHLSGNNDASTHQKNLKIIELLNEFYINYNYNLQQGGYQRPLIDHTYEIGLNGFINKIYLIDTNHNPGIFSEDLMKLITHRTDNIQNITNPTELLNFNIISIIINNIFKNKILVSVSDVAEKVAEKLSWPKILTEQFKRYGIDGHLLWTLNEDELHERFIKSDNFGFADIERVIGVLRNLKNKRLEGTPKIKSKYIIPRDLADELARQINWSDELRTQFMSCGINGRKLIEYSETELLVLLNKIPREEHKLLVFEQLKQIAAQVPNSVIPQWWALPKDVANEVGKRLKWNDQLIEQFEKCGISGEVVVNLTELIERFHKRSYKKMNLSEFLRIVSTKEIVFGRCYSYLKGKFPEDNVASAIEVLTELRNEILANLTTFEFLTVDDIANLLAESLNWSDIEKNIFKEARIDGLKIIMKSTINLQDELKIKLKSSLRETILKVLHDLKNETSRFLRSTLINTLLDLGYDTVNIIDLSCRSIDTTLITENISLGKSYECSYDAQVDTKHAVGDAIISNKY